jgi:streptogrisin C
MQTTTKLTVLCASLVAMNAAMADGATSQHSAAPETDDRTDHQLTGIHAPAVYKQAPREAELEDLTLVAQAKGWTLAQAMADRRAAEAVAAVAGALVKERRDLFVGTELSPEPGGAPRLYVKGPADALVQQLVAQADQYIEVRDNQPFSYDELEARKRAVHQALADLGFKDIMTSFDLRRGGAIEAAVTRTSGLPDTASRIQQALPATVRDGLSVRVMAEPVGEDYYAYGGMTVRDDGNSECTSGWSVINSFGTTGVTTAGHCTGINEINHPGVGIHSMSHQSEHRGSWGDIEWKTTGTTESADFYASSSAVRDVTEWEGWWALSIGESICYYGRFSNSRGCGLDVWNQSVSCTVNGVFNDRLVQMDGTGPIPGDSGGGWSWGNRAYGSTKGTCGGLAVFSFADYYDEALGVTVRTQ